MDYKKKYNEAQKWIESIYTELSHEQQMEAEAFFPELKESEDERIRKLLIEAVIQVLQDQYCSNRGVSKEKVVAWLEKQGEKTQQTPQWMIDFLDDNRSKFASLMEDYDEQREAEGKLLAIIAWLEKQEGKHITEPQSRWWPSEKQMQMLHRAIEVKAPGVVRDGLESLYNDLKNL